MSQHRPGEEGIDDSYGAAYAAAYEAARAEMTVGQSAVDVQRLAQEAAQTVVADAARSTPQAKTQPTRIAGDRPGESERKPGKRSTVGPVTVFGGIGALMLVVGVILLGADPCIKTSTVGCNPGSHTTFWAGTLTIVGFLTLFIAAWVHWFSRPPKE